MGWLTKSYLHWVRKRKRKNCKFSFDKYLDLIFQDMAMTNVMKIAFYEIHLLSEKLGRLEK
jgi:hypothetical protein